MTKLTRRGLPTLPTLFLLLFISWLAPTCPGQPADTPKADALGVIAGQSIYEADLAPLIQAQMRQLHAQEYELKRRALDEVVGRRLVEAEAKKRGLSAEKLIEQEVDSKVGEPTDAELEAYYFGLRDRLNRPLAEVKSQLQQALKHAKIQQARQDYVKRLWEKYQVVVLLRPPKTEVSYDAARVRGAPDAPVTIVEFSDFQCPFCQRAQAALKEVLAKYDGKVKLAYRDFPLQQIHPQAQMAAEASRCAGEQGKFWEYHDRLFAGPDKLDKPSLLEHARSLKLDEGMFEACLASGKYKAAVEKDVAEGNALGVSGTPAFFVNGIFLNGAQPTVAFEKIIDEELAAMGRGRTAPPAASPFPSPRPPGER
jgi:protein-disulfide isomerase